ncbi:periplasmic heavy metal sensor [Algoriphagus sp. H41]|uniref:Periplasmic heavy metal sensor n=1 Tax=Algoriphagus oliviformis TaxID=2811231 RepID=A0ABS3BY32_9BACT|nr:Spy/CpxP family protein refolding chaperone [Algoriphagus oliviformis]MBN7809321.1 periplasmic heavy metal sensor [Algoriphagus oliviformis]
MKKLLLILFLLGTGVAQAQDIFKMKIYSTDHLMEMRDEISLTDAQVAKIKKLHADNAGSFSTLKWDLDEATKKLKSMLDQPKIDQTAVSRQMDEVLRLENQMKKTQLNTMVSIKNELSPEQITKLEARKVLAVGKASSISGSQVQVVSGTGNATASSVNGTTSVSTSPKIAVSVAGSGKQPAYYIETKSGLKKVATLENIEPKDIESMSVFKGEEAIKKYGQEGENGVIVIKLKDKPE